MEDTVDCADRSIYCVFHGIGRMGSTVNPIRIGFSITETGANSAPAIFDLQDNQCSDTNLCGGQMTERYDVIVVGGGNAGFSAAHSAREHVERVLLLEKASPAWGGGNSYFTAG